MIGMVVGDLVVVGVAAMSPARRPGLSSRWHAVCRCGLPVARSESHLRSGRFSTCRHPAPSYDALHRSLKDVLGSASKRQCSECGATARDWAYDHSDPNEMVTTDPVTLVDRRFSLDLSRYQPMCRPCHVLFDLPHRERE